MIKRPSNWESVQAFSDNPKLPVGAYVCSIKKAVVEENDYGDQLRIAFDISDGEYAGFYADEFKNNPANTKKWKGVFRQWLPRNDGSEKDEWTKSSLKGLVNAIEESNRGFTWAWDETKLAGKEIGIIFRNEEWAVDGKTGWTVRAYKAISVTAVEEGKYKLPADKPLKNKAQSRSIDDLSGFPGTSYKDNSFKEIEYDGELPF